LFYNKYAHSFRLAVCEGILRALAWKTVTIKQLDLIEKQRLLIFFPPKSSISLKTYFSTRWYSLKSYRNSFYNNILLLIIKIFHRVLKTFYSILNSTIV
jgi:hypothetical protein